MLFAGYLVQGLLVRDPMKLRAHYMNTKKWRTDLASLIPTDFAYTWWRPSSCQVKIYLRAYAVLYFTPECALQSK